MPVLVPPLPRAEERLLRAAVLDLRSRELGQRFFGPVLHLGRPGTDHPSFPASPPGRLDDAVRADVVAAMLAARPGGGTEPAGPPMVWLTRTGPLAWHDVDAAWLAPTLRAFAEAGRALTFVVVTRQGWWDPRGDTGRVWARLRARS